MVEQLIAMEEYEVTLSSEKIASKFSPTGRAPTYCQADYIKAFQLSSIFGRPETLELSDLRHKIQASPYINVPSDQNAHNTRGVMGVRELPFQKTDRFTGVCRRR